MKKNFYKEFQKKQKIIQNYNENDKIIVEEHSVLLKMITYLITFIHSTFKVILFLLFILLLSVGATVICNNLLHINLLNIIGGKV